MIHRILFKMKLFSLFILHLLAMAQGQIEISHTFTLCETDTDDRRVDLDKLRSPPLNHTALDEITKLIGNRPVKVVSIVGGYHEGKSSFLNALLGADRFDVGERYEHETKGFNVVVRLDTSDTAQPAMMFIDTPGSGALDTNVAFQAAYFGVSYLISSTLVYNMKGVVINTKNLDNLASLLRTAISVNATLPDGSNLRLPSGTKDVILQYVVQNVDIEDRSTTPEEFAKRFYDDHNENKYELKSIFPDGIKPWVFPTPVPPDLLRKFSSASEPYWYSGYNATMLRFRQELFDDKSERQRIWQSVEDWKQRLRFSFDTDTFKTLAGLSVMTNKHVQEFLDNYFKKISVEFATQYFDREVDLLPVRTIQLTMQTLDEMEEKAIALTKKRAVSVPDKDLKQWIDQLVSDLRLRKDKALQQMELKVKARWEECVRDSTEFFEGELGREFAIPFDYRATESKDRALVAAAQKNLQDTASQLSANETDVEKYLKILTKAAHEKAKVHAMENKNRIESITSDYANHVIAEISTLFERETAAWSDHETPTANFPDILKAQADSVLEEWFSSQKVIKQGIGFVFDLKLVEWKNARFGCKEAVDQLFERTKALQSKRILNFANSVDVEKKESLQKCLEFPLPMDPKAVGRKSEKCHQQSLAEFDQSLQPFAEESVVKERRNELNSFAADEVKKLTDQNEKEIQRLIAAFGDHVVALVKDVADAATSNWSETLLPAASFVKHTREKLTHVEWQEFCEDGLNRHDQFHGHGYIIDTDGWNAAKRKSAAAVDSLMSNVSTLHSKRVARQAEQSAGTRKKEFSHCLEAISQLPLPKGGLRAQISGCQDTMRSSFKLDLKDFLTDQAVANQITALNEDSAARKVALEERNQELIQDASTKFEEEVKRGLERWVLDRNKAYSQGALSPRPTYIEDTSNSLRAEISELYKLAAGVPPWLTEEREWAVSKQGTERVYTDLVETIEKRQSDKVYTFAKQIQLDFEIIFNSKLEHLDQIAPLPKQVGDFDKAVGRVQKNMTDYVASALVEPYGKRYPVAKEVQKFLQDCAANAIEKLRESNNIAWSKIVEKPLNRAKDGFKRHLKDCNAITLNCSKFASVLLGLPNVLGTAGKMIEEQVQHAINNSDSPLDIKNISVDTIEMLKNHQLVEWAKDGALAWAYLTNLAWFAMPLVVLVIGSLIYINSPTKGKGTEQPSISPSRKSNSATSKNSSALSRSQRRSQPSYSPSSKNNNATSRNSPPSSLSQKDSIPTIALDSSALISAAVKTTLLLIAVFLVSALLLTI